MFKATPAIVTLWHTSATVAGTVLLPVLLGLFQYVSSHGVNVSQDLSYGIPVLVGGLATLPVSIWHAIQASPALPQAEKDVEAQAQAVGGHVANQLGTWLEGRLQALETSVLSHTHPAQNVVAPANVPPINLSQAGGVYNTSYIPTPPNNTAAVGMLLPQRSFTESALMPAVVPTK